MQAGTQTELRVTPEIRREIVRIVDERIKGVQVTKEDFSELKGIVGELAEAQKRTEARMEVGFQSLSDQIAALGSRWGIYNEGTFRSTIRGLLSRVHGMEVREGEYGGRQVDVIIRNGEHVLLEITARMHPGDIERLYHSADDYQAREGVEPALMVATSYISPRLMERIMGLERKIEIFSYEAEE